MIERSPRAHARFANGCGTRTSQAPRLAGPRDFDIEWFFLSLHRETFTGEGGGFPALNLRRFGPPRRVRTRGPCEFDSRPLFPGMDGASSAAGARGSHVSRARRGERIPPPLPRRCRRDRRGRPSLWSGKFRQAAEPETGHVEEVDKGCEQVEMLTGALEKRRYAGLEPSHKDMVTLHASYFIQKFQDQPNR